MPDVARMTTRELEALVASGSDVPQEVADAAADELEGRAHDRSDPSSGIADPHASIGGADVNAAIAEQRAGVPVNDHPTLTHDAVRAALRNPDPAELRRMAQEATTVGARDLAQQLRDAAALEQNRREHDPADVAGRTDAELRELITTADQDLADAAIAELDRRAVREREAELTGTPDEDDHDRAELRDQAAAQAEEHVGELPRKLYSPNAVHAIRRGWIRDPECHRTTYRREAALRILTAAGCAPSRREHAVECDRHPDTLSRVPSDARPSVGCSCGTLQDPFVWPEWVTDEIIDAAYRTADLAQTARGNHTRAGAALAQAKGQR